MSMSDAPPRSIAAPGRQPSFDPALLDALARCFVEAAADRLIAEQLAKQQPELRS
jgi:hypothetical protein